MPWLSVLVARCIRLLHGSAAVALQGVAACVCVENETRPQNFFPRMQLSARPKLPARIIHAGPATGDYVSVLGFVGSLIGFDMTTAAGAFLQSRAGELSTRGLKVIHRQRGLAMRERRALSMARLPLRGEDDWRSI